MKMDRRMTSREYDLYQAAILAANDSKDKEALRQILKQLIANYGPDSTLGRTAAVMLGATETTFYTIAVYFGAVGVTRTRYAVPAALCADLTGFLAAAWAVRLCFGVE